MMNHKYSVSKTQDKISCSVNRKIERAGLFENKEEYDIFNQKIKEIFEIKSINELYIEIVAIEKLDDEISKIVISDVSKIKPEDKMDINFISTFIRNCVTVISFMARRKPEFNSFFEIRIATAGNVDAGKSTLLGVLSNNILDDGRGIARSTMFRFQHEFDTGRTSSVGQTVICFDSFGNFITKHRSGPNRHEWNRVPDNAYKVIDFFDLAGHERYLKTTIYGLVGLSPDYTMLIIGANMGLVGMSKEHLGLSLALKIPTVFILTKIDMCPEDVRKRTLKNLIAIIKSVHVNKNYIMIRDNEDVITAFANIHSQQWTIILKFFKIMPNFSNFLCNWGWIKFIEIIYVPSTSASYIRRKWAYSFVDQ
uniref:GTP-binding protein 1 (Trinotate prediction) n=1 Tax=Henneguya salminicola TaxID=69463 RepID=A0A6G3MF79_HENSL